MTFLFTDIEGSTRRWEADPDAMRAALADHDAVLRAAIEGHDGWMFKHTGDGVIAAFGSARAALDAAVEAQRQLGLPVRMGVATGEAEQRGEDYFGPVLNRAARIMAAGHGGQILLAASTAGVVGGVGLVDLGEHRLRDLSGAEHLFQAHAEGLRAQFPALQTVDAVPGNLPVQSTSFVGRDLEVKELTELVCAHRLVTLTGVGGVGKTRLAVQVAAELVTEFPDGVWLVELAPVGDPAAVPDVVATVLGVTPQAAMSVTDSVAQALSGRRLLIVLDNCEHVLDAAADLVETILGRTTTVTVLATSREGLRVRAEHLWPVPSLEVRRFDGDMPAAVELFVERAQAVNPGFVLTDAGETEAVTQICQRLDGIALAIELAAARMVSMRPHDVRDRLGDRFRLLSGSRRGLERHQTLRHAVAWSYDLLSDDERAVLNRCAVFADGFDLRAATHVCQSPDEYELLDLLDSLVRKSLLTTQPTGDHARYGMLETIRQYAEDQLGASGTSKMVRDRHARFFADQAIAHWDLWDGPSQRVAVDWADVEFANLRAGFRWAVGQGDLNTASAIAAHTAVLAWVLPRFEAVGWAEEILDAATTADISHLPRVCTAASLCCYAGRPEAAVRFAHRAVVLSGDPRYDPFDPGWSGFWEAVANIYVGRLDLTVEIAASLAAQSGLASIAGLVMLATGLPGIGRAEEAAAIAVKALTAALARGNPAFIALAQLGCGRAFAEIEPTRALNVLREGLVFVRDHRLLFLEAVIAREAAELEAVHGDFREGLIMFDTVIESFQRAGEVGNAHTAFAHLVVLFDRLDRSEIAATLYGASSHHGDLVWVVNLQGALDHLHGVLGDEVFDRFAAAGVGMEFADAVRYARDQIQLAHQEHAEPV